MTADTITYRGRDLQPVYIREDDAVALVDKHGDVIVSIYRNILIRMLGELPPDPPARLKS